MSQMLETHQFQSSLVNFLQPCPQNDSKNGSTTISLAGGEQGISRKIQRARRISWKMARPSIRQFLAQRDGRNGGGGRVMQFRLIEVKTGFTGTVFHCLVYTSLWPASRDRGFTYGNKKNEQRYVCKFSDEAIPGGYSILVAKFTFVTILFFFFLFLSFFFFPLPPHFSSTSFHYSVVVRPILFPLSRGMKYGLERLAVSERRRKNSNNNNNNNSMIIIIIIIARRLVSIGIDRRR